MIDQERALLLKILDAVGKLPCPKQHQLLGVAQGMEMATATATEKEATNGQDERMGT